MNSRVKISDRHNFRPPIGKSNRYTKQVSLEHTYMLVDNATKECGWVGEKDLKGTNTMQCTKRTRNDDNTDNAMRIQREKQSQKKMKTN